MQPFKKNKSIFRFPIIIFIIGIFLCPKIAYFSSISDSKIIEYTNKERIKNGLNSLHANQLLTQAAYNKANDIIKNQTFSHTINNTSFSSWIKNTGYQYLYVGENLAINFVSSEGVVDAWMDSSSHKKNILNKNFTEIGIAVVEGNIQNKKTTLVVQIFGKPVNNLTIKNTENNSSDINILQTQKINNNITSQSIKFSNKFSYFKIKSISIYNIVYFFLKITFTVSALSIIYLSLNHYLKYRQIYLLYKDNK